MEGLILNRKFETIEPIDGFKSLIWTDRFRQYGDFELYLGMTDGILDYIVPDHYFWLGDSEHTMIIEGYNIKTDIEEGNYVIVTGRSLESILERRIVWGTIILSGNFQDQIEKLLNETFISPVIEDRKIDNFVFKRSDDERITGLTINAQYTGDNVYDIIQKNCEEKKIGFKVILTADDLFEFSLYAGDDRTYDQTKNPYVEFSPNNDNIINSSYYESIKLLKNVVLVAGEGEGAARRTHTIGSENGLDRRELFVDARDISSEVNGNPLSASDYNKLLNQRGLEKMSENIYVKVFEGKVDTANMYVYGKDFFMGDVVQIVNEYGIEGTAAILELIMSESEDGIECYPTFDKIE